MYGLGPGSLHKFGIDGDNDALATKTFCRALHEIRVLDGGGIDGDFISAGFQKITNIIQGAYASANCQRHKYLFGRTCDHIQNNVSLFVRGGNV